MKASLILVTIVGIFAAYSYFAYSRDLFPFTKEFKRKLNKILKGKEPVDDKELEQILGEEQPEAGMVDEFGSVLQPRGGTGARGIAESGGLSDPAIKGDLNLANLYQQELYRQLFLPYEDNPLEGEAIPKDTIVRGGDIPAENTPGVAEPYRYPFPVDERLNDMYGLFPPGGTYSGRDPYSPIHGRKPLFNPDVLGCHDCPEGMSWDNCRCQCSPVDSPRLICYRADCECPGGDYGDGNDGGPLDSEGGNGGIHMNGGDPNCPPGYEFDSCRCQCVTPDTPSQECIRNCTECPEDQWYSFCTGQCVSGRQRQCEPEIYEHYTDIPDFLPDDLTAEVGDLRALRDRLLQEIADLRDELEAKIDELRDRLAEEQEKREELEELVADIQEEMEHDEGTVEERIEHREEREHDIVNVQQIIERIRDDIRDRWDDVTRTRERVTMAVAEVNNVDSRMSRYQQYRSSYNGGSSSSGSYSGTYANAGSGTYSSTGGGSATACAGGRCITAGLARARLAGDMTKKERQFAFSKLQHKSRRMKTI